MQFTPFYTPTLVGRKRVYVSGPMSGLPELNATAFDEAAEALRELDYAVCNPIETSQQLGKLSHAEYLRFDFQRVLEADFLVALDGWEDSVGARAEILMAIRMGTKVWDWATWGQYNLITEDDVTSAICKARWASFRSALTFTYDNDSPGYFGPWFGIDVVEDIGTQKTIKEIVGCTCDEEDIKIGGTD